MTGHRELLRLLAERTHEQLAPKASRSELRARGLCGAVG